MLMVVIVAIVTVVMSVIVGRVGTVVGMVVMLLTLVKPQSLLIHSTSIWALGNDGRPNRDFFPQRAYNVMEKTKKWKVQCNTEDFLMEISIGSYGSNNNNNNNKMSSV